MLAALAEAVLGALWPEARSLRAAWAVAALCLLAAPILWLLGQPRGTVFFGAVGLVLALLLLVGGWLERRRARAS